jgi:DNA polymerase
LVGEAPGRKEDETGRPFVGSAGKLLDKLLDSVGISREKIYITNILKCRPPNNRRPRKHEVELCKIYLYKILDVITPSILISLGTRSLTFFPNWFGLKKAVIGDVHGQVFEIDAPWGKVKFIPLYHPAASIYRRNLLSELREDLQRVACILRYSDN